ncbi:MAG: hypothetical protein LBQ14_01645 [Treponema sp.]|nr:hypothetical protein [Treponema sp.]
MTHGIMSVTAFPSVGYAISASLGGRMSLPVAPSSLIYSHFEHVSGVPAPDGSRGVTINKLKILNVLIEQLGQIKKQPQNAGSAGPLSDERIDALIEQYESQIRSARAASAAMPYKPRPAAPLGAVFSLVA